MAGRHVTSHLNAPEGKLNSHALNLSLPKAELTLDLQTAIVFSIHFFFCVNVYMLKWCTCVRRCEKGAAVVSKQQEGDRSEELIIENDRGRQRNSIINTS